MQARFLLGPAGSGKTFRCLAEIRAALRASPVGEPLILIAPKQATFQLERQLLADDSLNGFTRLQILSFDRLARFVLETLGVTAPDFLSEEGRVMVLRALLLRHEGELKLFGRSARRPGFAQEVSGLLNEFQQHQITPARLRALAANKDLPPELQSKLHDCALLFEGYTSWLKEHGLQDGNHLLDFATETLRSRSALHGSRFALGHLWLDGFAEMTPQELDLLAAVVPSCDRATLAFCLEAEPPPETSWLSIWSSVGKTFQQCRQRIESLPGCEIGIETLGRNPGKTRFAQSPELAWLEEFWTRPAPRTQNPKDISLVVCADAGAEAVFAAREILKFVRKGNRFRDCAVLVRNLDAYHKPLVRAFHRYGIPLFLDRRESVAHHPLAELTRSALRTVAFDWRHDDWFAALKSGFTPVEEAEIDRLENIALEFGWRGKKWRAPLLDENLERLREKISPPFEKLARRLARLKNLPNGVQLAEALRELWADLKVESRLQAWSDDRVRDPQSTVHTTVLEQMNGWLDNVALAFPREPLSLRDWLPILEAGLANLTVGVIPPALDQVLIGAIDRARNPDLKLMFALGVNESVFPAALVASTILSEADRDELGQTIPLGPDLRDRIARERYYGYIACTRAGEKLVLTYARHGTGGKALNPSPFIAHLKWIFPGLETEEFSGEVRLDDAEHVGEVALRIEIQGWPGLLEIPALKARVTELRALREPDEQENLSPALAERLYQPTLQSSVSRLEEFAQCPFKFFIRSGLRAQERKTFELDARERGSFQHDVLKTFHERLTADGKRWRDVTPMEARERIGKIADELAAGFRDGLLRDSAQAQFEARALASSLQDFIEVVVSWMHSQYEFNPAAVELGFGGKDDRLPAWKIELAGGHKLALQGRIDRVDLWRDPAGDGALAVVLDYKSSNKKLDRVLIENGVQLQLLAYLAALRHWPVPPEIFQVARLVPAGVFYVNLRGDYQGGGTRAEILAEAGEARRLAYRHSGRFDAGALPHLDHAQARDQFNYQLKSNGELYTNSKEALPHGEFEKLLDGVEVQLRGLGGKIFSGAARVDPYRKGSVTACAHCEYQAACRIDRWTHQYRVLRAVSEPGG